MHASRGSRSEPAPSRTLPCDVARRVGRVPCKTPRSRPRPSSSPSSPRVGLESYLAALTDGDAGITSSTLLAATRIDELDLETIACSLNPSSEHKLNY